MRLRHLGFLFCSGLSGLTSFSGEALAHGKTWLPDQVLVEPGQPNHILLRSDGWGAIQTLDGGATWQWICGEDYGGSSLNNPDHRSIVMLPGGDVVVAAEFGGLMRAGAALCNFVPVGGFEQRRRCAGYDCITLAVTGSQETAKGLLVSTEMSNTPLDASVPPPDLLWHSPDGGDHWDANPKALPSGMMSTDVRVAPSDPRTIYDIGMPNDLSPSAFIVSSHDGGDSWDRVTIDTTGSTADSSPPAVRIQGIDPANAQVAFFLLDYQDAVTLGTDRLYETVDGGETLRLVYQATGNLQGFAFTPDSKTLYIGGEQDGLLKANVADIHEGGASADAGPGVARNPAFTRVSDGGFCGLAWTSNGLLAGRDDLLVPVSQIESRYLLGLSKDLGVTFTPTFHLCDVTAAQCGADTTYGSTCPALFNGDGNFFYDFLRPEAERCVKLDDAGTPRTDASTPVEPEKDAGRIDATPPEIKPTAGAGCDCRIDPGRESGGSSRGPRGLLGALFTLALVLRRVQCLK